MAHTIRNDRSDTIIRQLEQAPVKATVTCRDFDCGPGRALANTATLEELMRERHASRSGIPPSNSEEFDMFEIVRRVAQAKPHIVIIGECRDAEAARAKLEHLIRG